MYAHYNITSVGSNEITGPITVFLLHNTRRIDRTNPVDRDEDQWNFIWRIMLFYWGSLFSGFLLLLLLFEYEH